MEDIKPCRTTRPHVDLESVSSTPLPRLLYDRKEAARQLSISIRSLDYMIAGRQVDTRRIGSRILIAHSELVRIATSARVKSVV